jgi:hypothetical protein
MKRKIAIGCMVLLTAMLVGVAAAEIEEPLDPTLICIGSEGVQEYPLYAGQTIYVGNVTIWNDDEYLYVKYTTIDDWFMSELHVMVGYQGEVTYEVCTGHGKDEVCENVTEWGCIWPDKTVVNGNPVPGQFPYKWELEHGEDPIQEYSFAIPLNMSEEDGLWFDYQEYPCFCVAAHAVVHEENGGHDDEETAWSGEEPFPGNNWANYMKYCLQSCVMLWKTVDTSHAQGYEWTIVKEADPDEVWAEQGCFPPYVKWRAFLNYTVTVDAVLNDTNWTVNGTIYLKNNGLYPVNVTALNDTADGVLAFVNCTAPFILGVNETLMCEYNAELDEGEDGINNVTATIDFNGTVVSGSYEAEYTFGNGNGGIIEDCVNVTDSRYGYLGEVCGDEVPKIFKYKKCVSFCRDGIYNVTNVVTYHSDVTNATGNATETVKVHVVYTPCPEPTEQPPCGPASPGPTPTIEEPPCTEKPPCPCDENVGEPISPTGTGAVYTYGAQDWSADEDYPGTVQDSGAADGEELSETETEEQPTEEVTTAETTETPEATPIAATDTTEEPADTGTPAETQTVPSSLLYAPVLGLGVFLLMRKK